MNSSKSTPGNKLCKTLAQKMRNRAELENVHGNCPVIFRGRTIVVNRSRLLGNCHSVPAQNLSLLKRLMKSDRGLRGESVSFFSSDYCERTGRGIAKPRWRFKEEQCPYNPNK